MYNMRYPEIPSVAVKKKGLEIEFNGVKLYLSQSYAKHIYDVRLAKIDRGLDGRIEEEDFQISEHRKDQKADNKFLSRKINLFCDLPRGHLMNIVAKYATWFSDYDKAKLEDVILRHTMQRPQEAAAPVANGKRYHNEHLHKEQRRQSKDFSDKWRDIFRDNS